MMREGEGMWRGANQLDSHFQGICLLIGGVRLNIRHSTGRFICMFYLILTGRWSICYSFQARKLKLKGSSNLCKVSKLEWWGFRIWIQIWLTPKSVHPFFLRPWKRQIKCWCFPQISDLKGFSCQLVQETAPDAKSLVFPLEPLSLPENYPGQGLFGWGWLLPPHHSFLRRRHQRLRQGHKEKEGVRKEPPRPRKLGGGVGGGGDPPICQATLHLTFLKKLRSQLLLQGRVLKQIVGGRGYR